MPAKTSRVTELTRHYDRLEAEVPIVVDEAFGQLVVPNGNDAAAIHRWFHLKESFSSTLLSSVIARVGLKNATNLSLIDPFAGVGTSLVSALDESGTRSPRFTHVVGIERNPFLHLVASSKVRSLVDGVPALPEFIESVMGLYRKGNVEPAPRPSLSTFAKAEYFPRATLRDLLRLKTAIDVAEGDELARDIARVCLAGCLEPASRLRRDGRALRYEDRKAPVAPLAEFERRAEVAIADVEDKAPVGSSARVALGDGRRPKTYTRETRFRMALFSPPYPNNIDYTEVYKLENWFLGLIGSETEFRAQRLRTVRSHPSVAFNETYELSVNGYQAGVKKTLDPLLNAIPTDRYRHQRRRLIRGYFDDMLQSLKELYELLEADGHLVYVVGNSAHGHGDDSFVVASDLLMASLARLVGFKVNALIVARFPSRRRIPSSNASSRFLRESVVILER